LLLLVAPELPSFTESLAIDITLCELCIDV
jgi:hypothetical protein